MAKKRNRSSAVNTKFYTMPNYAGFFLLASLCLPVLVAPIIFSSVYYPYIHILGLISVSLLGLTSYLFFSAWTKKQRFIFPTNTTTFALIGFILWMLTSLLWTQSVYIGAEKLQYWIVGLAAYFCVFSFVTSGMGSNAKSELKLDYRKAELMMLTFLFVATIASILGVFQYLFNWNWPKQVAAPGSFFVNKNMASQYVMLSIPFALLNFLYQTQRKNVYIAAVSCCFLVTYILLAHSRGVWLSVGLQLLLLAIAAMLSVKSKRSVFKRVNKQHILAGTTALFFSFFILSLNPFHSDEKLAFTNSNAFTLIINKAKQGLNDDSETLAILTNRNIYWSASLGLFKSNPILGVGLGSWSSQHIPFIHENAQNDKEIEGHQAAINAHQDYLEYLAETGVIGLSLFLFLIASTLVFVKKAIIQFDIDTHYIPAACVIAIMSLYLNALFSFPFQKPLTIIMFCAMLGLSAGLLNTQDNDRMKILLKPGVVIFIVLISVFYLVFNVTAIQGRKFYAIAQGAAMASDDKWIKKATLLAQESNPWDPRYNILLNRSLSKQKSYKNVIKQCDKFIVYFPFDYHCLLNKGIAHYKTREYKEAFVWAERTYAIGKNWGDANLLLGKILLKLSPDNRNEALTYIKRAIELESNGKNVTESMRLLKNLNTTSTTKK